MDMLSHRKPLSAFSLIELSMVIVMISILAASVLGMSSVLRISGLKSVISDLQYYREAINSYYNKYGYYPGDDPNLPATDNANTRSWNCSGCWGDGNFTVGNAGAEQKNVWYHLYSAGIVEKAYTGQDKDIPYNKWDKGYYNFLITSSPTFGSTGSLLRHGTYDIDGYITKSIFTAKNNFYIDNKIDDGIAYTGEIFGYNPDAVNNGCPSLGSVNVTYDQSVSSVTCMLIYWVQKNPSN